MGKASRWLRSLLGLKKSDHPQQQQQQLHEQQQLHPAARPKEKRRWSFVKSYREKDNPHPHPHPHPFPSDEDQHPSDPNHRAIAVAAATAAVADAAVAAAHAAAEVVRLTTTSGRSPATASSPAYVTATLGFAALKIQAAFRGYLARRALKALRGVVILQALVRGDIQRKRTLAWPHHLQAMLMAQARARVGRIQASESSLSSTAKSTTSHCHYNHQLHNPGPATPEKSEHGIRTKSGKYDPPSLLKSTVSRSKDNNKAHPSLRRSETRSVELSWDQQQQQGPWKATVEDEKNSSVKILEIDNGGELRHHHHHHFGHHNKRRNLFHSANLSFFSDQYSHSFTSSKDTAPSPSSGEVQSMYPLGVVDQDVFCTAENSPQLYSASSSRGGGGGKRSPFTPSRSDGSRSFLSSFADHPNYMSYTESSRAKARSLSAPKQRPCYERSSSAKRFSVNGYGEPRSSSAQRASAVRASFSSKAYPGSGRLDSFGMPMWQKC